MGDTGRSRKAREMYWYTRRMLYAKLALGGLLSMLAVSVYFLAR